MTETKVEDQPIEDPGEFPYGDEEVPQDEVKTDGCQDGERRNRIRQGSVEQAVEELEQSLSPVRSNLLRCGR